MTVLCQPTVVSVIRDSSIRTRCASRLFLLGAIFIGGCAPQSVAPAPQSAAPASELPPVDGEVELLVVAENGEVGHAPGTFLEAIQTKDKVVVVDFWATWCGPCKLLAPELEKVAAENPDVLVVKVDVDKAGDLAFHYQASAIPDVRIFRNGKVVEQIVGFRTADQLLEVIRGS